MTHRKTWGIAGVLFASAALVLAADPPAPQRPQPAQPQPGDGSGRFRPDPEQLFKRFDADGDGKITWEEFQKFAAISPRLKDDALAQRAVFDDADRDNDGKLTNEEFTSWLRRQFANRPPDAGNPRQPGVPNRRPGFPGSNPPAASTDDSPDKLTTEQSTFFEKKIRPVLAANCYDCHSAGAKKVKGGLLLDTKLGIRKGGDTGPAIVPGEVAKSLLVTAIKGGDQQLQMPPKKKLTDEQIADLEQWVKMGAPDPRGGQAVAHSDIDIAKGKQYWAFQPPTKSAAPEVKDAAWPKSNIDRFLLSAMEAKGVKPVADADKSTLLRRVTYDLTGLPPTPAQIEAFLADTSADALEKVIDRLMATPAFGERWGRHWLDVARYAESSGKTVNINFPHAWRYRDYVMDSFNADKPFDQFVKEQVAGDLMPSKDDQQKAERTIATGFLAIGTKSLNERNRLQFEMDLVDEQIDAVSSAFLATTVACARCHDHKFDPIAQRDYYALAGIFRSTNTEYGTARGIQNGHPSTLIELPKASNQPAGVAAMSQAELADLKSQVDDLKRQRADALKDRQAGGINQQLLFIITRLGILEAKYESFNADGTPKTLVMGVRDGRPQDSPLLVRGDVATPGQMVPRGLPQVMVSGTGEVRSRSSGRMELAEFLGSKQNPLAARVWVNRVWLHLFGQGIVTSPDNFGVSGARPSNQPLLDTLAVGFMDNGWSTKKLIKQLMLTRAYQLSSKFDPTNDGIDPDNVLVWRASKRRLEAEPIRDSLLAVAGTMEESRPVGSTVARAGDGPSQILGRFGGLIDNKDKHRSVYLPIVRDQLPEVLATFDFAEASQVSGLRATTSVPSQMLYLLNSPFVINAADSAAAKLAKEADTDPARVRLAYLKVYGREPTDEESQAALKFLNDYAASITSASSVTPAAKRDAWVAFMQSLMGSAEFLYLN